ncbi:hypothetical protein SK128_023014 [Halocaridina rubra]|uniref:Uncharacterized protein n=1 Tax=Halocaridina rubra TaxID=373956 RepID=A0AAN9ACH0_HALRR
MMFKVQKQLELLKKLTDVGLATGDIVMPIGTAVLLNNELRNLRQRGRFPGQPVIPGRPLPVPRQIRAEETRTIYGTSKPEFLSFIFFIRVILFKALTKWTDGAKWLHWHQRPLEVNFSEVNYRVVASKHRNGLIPLILLSRTGV